METALENAALRLLVNARTGEWEVRNLKERPSGVQSGMPRVFARTANSPLRIPDPKDQPLSSQSRGPSVHGPLDLLELVYPARPTGLELRLVFAIPAEHPLLLWKLELYNPDRQTVLVDRLEMLRTPRAGKPLDFGKDADRPAFFANGWQSWSYAGAYSASERYRRTRLGPFRAPTDFNPGTPQPWQRGHFGSDMFGVVGDRRTRQAILAGFISQQQHFGSLEARLDPLRLHLWANGDGASLLPGEHMQTDWACLHFVDVDVPDPLEPYLQAVARQNGLPARLNRRIPTGWCSWYQFSTPQYTGAVSAWDIQNNLEQMRANQPDLPLQICQIDDGFQDCVGDWQVFSPGFPGGTAPLAAEIRQAGLIPGIWLAPFIIDRRSRTASDHPNWLLKGPSGLPANAGYLWGRFAGALDLTQPAALEYAVGTIHTAAHDWGFQYLKLDFLYAAALPGQRHDPTRTRAQVLRAGLNALRQAAGEDVELLGCSCPLGPAIGMVDAMRIGADTASHWRPSFLGMERPFRDEPNLPSARNALLNAVQRAPLHRRWWANDPDCLLLRPTTNLTHDEVLTAASIIAITGGSLVISDDLAALPPGRRWIASLLLPLIGETPRVLDWFDGGTPRRLRLDLHGPAGDWSLVAYVNWDDRPAEPQVCLQDYGFSTREFYARRFWQPQRILSVERLEAATPLPLGTLPAHATALYTVRACTPGLAQYLGSDLHISQGLEVVEFTQAGQGDSLHIRLERPGKASGRIFLALPFTPAFARLNGTTIESKPCGRGCYALKVDFERDGRLEIG